MVSKLFGTSSRPTGTFSKNSPQKLHVHQGAYRSKVLEPVVFPPKSILFPESPRFTARSNTIDSDTNALLATVGLDAMCSPVNKLIIDAMTIDDTLGTEIHITGSMMNTDEETMDLSGIVIAIPFDRKIRTYIGMKGIWQQESPKEFELECWEALVFDAMNDPVQDLCGIIDLRMIYEGIILSFSDAG